MFLFLQGLYEDQGFQQALKSSYGKRPAPVSKTLTLASLLTNPYFASRYLNEYVHEGCDEYSKLLKNVQL